MLPIPNRRDACAQRCSTADPRPQERSQPCCSKRSDAPRSPVFIFLGLVFALSFVFLGVGSGAGGISLGNLLGQSSGSSTTSVSDLLNKVHSDPKDATAWRQLGDAYQTNGQTTLALGAYAQYMNLRPKDANTITQVATLYETRGPEAGPARRLLAVAGRPVRDHRQPAPGGR